MAKDRRQLWSARAVCAARHVLNPAVALENVDDYWEVVGRFRCREEVGRGRRCDQSIVAFAVLRNGTEHTVVNTEALADALFAGDRGCVDGVLVERYMDDVRFPKPEQ